MGWVALPGYREFQVLSSSRSSSWLTVLTGGSDPNLCTAPSNPFTVQGSTLPGQLGLVSTNCALNLSSLLAGQLLVCMSFRSATTPLPLSESLSAAPTLQLRSFEPLPAFCTLHLPKRQNIFLHKGWPQPASASDSLRSHSFSWTLFVGAAAKDVLLVLCVHPESLRFRISSNQVSPN